MYDFGCGGDKSLITPVMPLHDSPPQPSPTLVEVTMHYYQFHVGDYLRDTAHLTLEEDATYRRLLDFYYESESPIPDDVSLVARKIRSSPVLVACILSEYFTQTENGHTHARVEAELKAYHDMVNGGRKGAAKRWHKGNDTHPIPTPSAGDGQGIATGMLTMNHEPITNNHIKEKDKVTAFAVPEWVDLETWTEYVKTRKPKARSAGSLKAVVKKLEGFRAAGHNVNEILSTTLANGWQGLFEPKPVKGVGATPLQKKVENCAGCGKPLLNGHTQTQQGKLCSPCWGAR